MPGAKKRPPNAFALFLKEEFKSRQSNTHATEHTKAVARKWREMDASQKQIWLNLAAQVKSKFPKRQPTTSGRPKKPRSAFIFFCCERREQVRRENPTKRIAVISKILGKMWNRLSAEEKAKYSKMAESDKKRYYGARTPISSQAGQRSRASGHRSRSRTRNQSAPQTPHAQRTQARNPGKARDSSSRNSFFSSRFDSSSSESSESEQD